MPLSSRDSIGGASRERWPDAELLALFLQRRGARSEDAFAELVGRHGPLVLRACRAIAGDEHAAEDAFQATFLVLARKADRLWVRDSLAPWLHGVACRIARDVRKSAAGRRRFERRVAAMGDPAAAVVEPDAGDDLAAIVQEEIGRLPEPHRATVVLCDLQGRTHQEAARLLGCPVGTIKSRQARARERLRERLERRGLALTSALLGLLLSDKPAPGGVAPGIVRATASAATRFASSVAGRTTGVIGPPAELLALTESACGAIAGPRRGLVGRRAPLGRVLPVRMVFLVVPAVAAVVLVAAPVLQARLAGRSRPGPPPRGSIASLRWKEPNAGETARTSSKLPPASINKGPE